MDEYDRLEYEAYLEAKELEEKEASNSEPVTVESLLASLVVAGIPYDLAEKLTIGQLTALFEEVAHVKSDSGSGQ